MKGSHSGTHNLDCPYCGEWDCGCECIHGIAVPNPKAPHTTEIREFIHCPLCGRWIDVSTPPQEIVRGSLRKAIAMLKEGESREVIIQRLSEVIYDQTSRQLQ